LPDDVAGDAVSVLDGPGEGTWSVFAAKVVEERDALREEVEQLRASRATLILLVNRLAADRRQVYARLREIMPWVGQCPFNPSQAREMFLLRDLASDTLREVSLDLDRAEIVSTSVVVETTGDDDGKDDQ
jgi:hypothetical protein